MFVKKLPRIIQSLNSTNLMHLNYQRNWRKLKHLLTSTSFWSIEFARYSLDEFFKETNVDQPVTPAFNEQ